MKFDVQDLMSICCYCDVYRKVVKNNEAAKQEISIAEAVIAEAKESEVSQERSC